MKLMRAIWLIIVVILILQVDAQVKVKGYTRKDGTYVSPHYRSNPDGNPYNNWSFPGNTNPYTGKTATGNPDTYLRNYYNRTPSSGQESSISYQKEFPTPNPNKVSIEYLINRNVLAGMNSGDNDKNNINGDDSFDNSYINYYVTAESLNVRSGPSVDYNVIDTLSYAKCLNVIDSYSNGWKKIQYTYFDLSSYSTKTKDGYVSGYYLSVSNPNSNANNTFSNNYNSEINQISTTNNKNIYSSTSKATSLNGDRNGEITIWTNCGTDGEIKVFLDDEYVGSLTQYFTIGVPNCGETGTLFIHKPVGNYKLDAKGNQNIWSSTVTITENKCLIHELKK